MSPNETASQAKTLTDFMRRHTSGITTRIGRALHGWGVHPDVITFLGVIIVAIAGYVAAEGRFFWAALILLAGAPLDAVDGAVARAMQRKDQFGAFWDSSLDRYADGFIFMGLAYYFSNEGDQTAMLLSVVALLGSILVSYERARAEGLGLDCKVGLLTRMERMIIIVVMLFTGWVVPGLWVLAVGTHFTVFQRIRHVHHTIKQQGDEAA